MYIKSINNVIGYKDLPNGLVIDFDENTTYIVGENYQGKTTIGSLFNWCLTGTTLYGNEKEQVVNDETNISNVVVDMTFIDNYGIEHRLIRDKGKQMNLTLDGKEIKQDMLANFYQDKDIFLVSHNPYYFASLEPKEQKELIRRIIPAISKEDSFKLLNENEQKIIGSPIEHLGSYIDRKNEEINELQKEYDENIGRIEAYKNISFIQIGNIIKFDKEEELKKLKERYETISMNFSSSNVENLQHSIKRINERIEEIINEKLTSITENYNNENTKIKNIEQEQSICPTCNQEIKDNRIKENLINFYHKKLNMLQEKANKLKLEAKDLVNERKEKQKLLEKLNTLDMQKLQEEKENLKSQIDALEKEKSEILLHNKEVETKQEQLQQANNSLDISKKAIQEIKEEIENARNQKVVANKLKRLVIEEQREMINKYLDKVEIQFCRENKTNGKIIECCDIYYEGREYKKLSKSQQIRACLEISNMFNNLSKINAPIFLDDAESITDIQQMANTQMIISLVIKYNPLEILYDYSDVLDRKKKSIDKEFIEKENYKMDKVA